MPRLKGSKNKVEPQRINSPMVEYKTLAVSESEDYAIVIDSPAQDVYMPAHEVELAEKSVDLSAKILKRIYHPEDFPHDCPSPREDMDGFLRWLAAHT